MRFTFRLTLTTLLVVLLMTGVGLIGGLSISNTRFVSRDLIGEILDQASGRVDGMVERLLYATAQRARINRDLFSHAGRGKRVTALTARDFPWLGDHLFQVMRIRREFSRMSVSIDATGEICQVKRIPPGYVVPALEPYRSRMIDALVIENLRLITGKGRRLTSWIVDRKGRKIAIIRNQKATEDARARPFFQVAQSARDVAWTDVYMTTRDLGPTTPAISCAAPIMGRSGQVTAVVEVELDALALSEFLSHLQVGRHGFAFLVALEPGHVRHVFAHPQLAHLLARSWRKGRRADEFLHRNQLDDRLLTGFLDSLPGNLDPRALQARNDVTLSVDGVDWIGAYRTVRDGHGRSWLACIVVPDGDFMGAVYRNEHLSVTLAGLVVIVGILASVMVATRISAPLHRLAAETEDIGRFHVEPQEPHHSFVAEVDRLAVATEQMKTNLRSFGKFVPTDLVRELVASGREATLGGENRTLTVYFSDLRDFTSLAEQMEPTRLVELLGEYLSAMSREIEEAGGTVDKFIGDAVMAFWGAPRENPQHALSACRAALRNQKTLAGMRERWQAEGRPVLHAAIGLNTGSLIVGNIGSESRMNYTIIGDSVNLASRLEGLNKYYGTTILISDTTLRLVREHVVARPVDRVAVKGRHEGLVVHELLALAQDASAAERRLAALSTQALEAHWAREFEHAAELFEAVRQLHPGDRAAELLLIRSQAYRVEPPPPIWDGTHHMETK